MYRRPFACLSGLFRAASNLRCRSVVGWGPQTLPRLLVAAVVALYVVVVPTTAEAQGDDVITIVFDDVVFAPAGSLLPVGSVAVDSDLQGRTCRTSVITANQSSIHPENNLLITTGGSTARIVDVEDFTNGTNSWLLDITLGSTIDMSVEMGPDGVSSLGFVVEIDCSKPLVGTTVPVLASSVTTTTTSTTVGSETTSTTSATTTTIPTLVESTTSETTGTTTTTNSAESSTQLQVQETTTTIATTVSSTTAPTVTIPTTTTTQTAETTTTTAAQGQLEQSPPASAVPAQPSYTG